MSPTSALQSCSAKNQSQPDRAQTRVSLPPGHDRADYLPVSIKHKVAFAMLMGVITTGIISCTLISLNLGFNERFLRTWLKSWAVGYLVVIPAILILSPMVQRAVDRLLRSNKSGPA